MTRRRQRPPTSKPLATLRPIFRRHPTAFAPKIAAMAREYIERCERAEIPIDEDVLAPIVALLPAEAGTNAQTEEE